MNTEIAQTDPTSVVGKAIGDHDAPGTLLGVTALGWPDQLVEIEAVAVMTAAG